MKTKILLIFIFLNSILNAQNTFFIGDKSYPCTSTFTLKSNSNDRNDLNVLIAKDGISGLLAASTKVMTPVVFIKGTLIIYLNDGTVITCYDRGKYDKVDNIVTNVYYLTKDELGKMGNSNINTIRYSLKCNGYSSSSEEGNFSVSNTKSAYGINYDNINGFSNKSYSTIAADVPQMINDLFPALFKAKYIADSLKAMRDADLLIEDEKQDEIKKSLADNIQLIPKITYVNGYKSIIVGEQTWMAYNYLDATAGSYCYGEKTIDCYNYGRLYTYDAALKACPAGWHIPTYDDWDKLINYLGGWEKAGGLLKDNLLGYNFKLCGFRDEKGVYSNIDTTGGYWTSTPHTNYKDEMYIRYIISNSSSIQHEVYLKQCAFGVRYIKD
jgi:uncharacterized protein (TIGR02145 family)